MRENTKIYLKLVNFNQFAFMGIFFKFFGLYLKGEGLSDDEIGMIYMLAPLTHIVVTLFFGYISNRFQLEEKLLKLLLFASFATSLIYFYVGDIFVDLFFGFVISTILFSIVRSPVLAMLDSTSLAYIKIHGGEYSKIRMWGSVGFIFSVMLISLLREQYPALEELTLYGISFFLLLAYLSALKIGSKEREDKNLRLKEVLEVFRKNKLLVWFFLMLLLHIISTAAYHIFFGLYLLDESKGLGFPSSYLGYMTFIAVFSEIIFFKYSTKLEKLYSKEKLLSLIFLLSAFRWLIYYETKDILYIILAQLIHSMTWGGFFLLSIKKVESYFKGRLRTSGISLLYVIAFGIGNTLGFLIWGKISEKALRYGDIFFYCTVISLLVFIISVLLGIAEKRSTKNK